MWVGLLCLLPHNIIRWNCCLWYIEKNTRQYISIVCSTMDLISSFICINITTKTFSKLQVKCLDCKTFIQILLNEFSHNVSASKISLPVFKWNKYSIDTITFKLAVNKLCFYFKNKVSFLSCKNVYKSDRERFT